MLTSTDPVCYNKLDIVQVQDLTNSFRRFADSMASGMPTFLERLQLGFEDLKFGLSSFKDKPVLFLGEKDDYCYKLHNALSSDWTHMDFHDMKVGGGADDAENQFGAMLNAVNDPDMSWREDNSVVRVSLMITDERGHGYDLGSGEYDYPYNSTGNDLFEVAKLYDVSWGRQAAFVKDEDGVTEDEQIFPGFLSDYTNSAPCKTGLLSLKNVIQRNNPKSCTGDRWNNLMRLGYLMEFAATDHEPAEDSPVDWNEMFGGFNGDGSLMEDSNYLAHELIECIFGVTDSPVIDSEYGEINHYDHWTNLEKDCGPRSILEEMGHGFTYPKGTNVLERDQCPPDDTNRNFDRETNKFIVNGQTWDWEAVKDKLNDWPRDQFVSEEECTRRDYPTPLDVANRYVDQNVIPIVLVMGDPDETYEDVIADGRNGEAQRFRDRQVFDCHEDGPAECRRQFWQKTLSTVMPEDSFLVFGVKTDDISELGRLVREAISGLRPSCKVDPCVGEAANTEECQYPIIFGRPEELITTTPPFDELIPTESTEPTEEPTEPTEEPTEPTEEPTGPTEEPTEPTEEPTEPTEEPTGPTEEPTEPTEEPTEPSEEPTGPTEEPTEPSEEPTGPTEEPIEPDTEDEGSNVGLIAGASAGAAAAVAGIVGGLAAMGKIPGFSKSPVSDVNVDVDFDDVIEERETAAFVGEEMFI